MRLFGEWATLPPLIRRVADHRQGCNLVTTNGERKEEKEDKGKTFNRVERRTGKFPFFDFVLRHQ